MKPGLVGLWLKMIQEVVQESLVSPTGNLKNLEIFDLDYMMQLDGVSTTSTVVDSLTKIQAVPVSILLDNMIEK